MQKPILLIAALLVILLISAFLILKIPSKGESLPTKLQEATSSMMPAREPIVYKNKIYNFEFLFPFNLSFKESSPEAVIVGNINDLQTESLAEVHVVTQPLLKKQKQNLSQFILENAKKLCNYSDTTVIVQCELNEKVESGINRNSQNYQTFYLLEKTIDQETGEQLGTKLNGPFFSFDISMNTPGSQSAILISPPLQKTTTSNPQLVKEIADSLNTFQSPKPTPK